MAKKEDKVKNVIVRIGDEQSVYLREVSERSGLAPSTIVSLLLADHMSKGKKLVIEI